MKIAVPITRNGQIDEHFGHCEFYTIYTTTENKEISDVQTIKSEQGCGCKSNIAFTLANAGVTHMLAGGIGGGAIQVLNNVGIEVIRGCSGIASDNVKLFIEGKISDNGSSCEQHEAHHQHGHEHHHDHTCNH
jgi:predicted Fe-Mo cluster-binding NifX family protein